MSRKENLQTLVLQPNPLSRRTFLGGTTAAGLGFALGAAGGLAVPLLGQRPGLIEDDGAGTDPRGGFGLDSLLVNDTRTFDAQDRLIKVTGDGNSTAKPYVGNLTYDSGAQPDFASGSLAFTYNAAYMGDFGGSLNTSSRFGRFEWRDYENRKLILDIDLRSVEFNDVIYITGYRQNKDGSRVNIDAWLDFVQAKWVGGNSSDIIRGPIGDELITVMQNGFPLPNPPSGQKIRDEWNALTIPDIACLVALVLYNIYCWWVFYGPLCRFATFLCGLYCPGGFFLCP